MCSLEAEQKEPKERKKEKERKRKIMLWAVGRYYTRSDVIDNVRSFDCRDTNVRQEGRGLVFLSLFLLFASGSTR